MLRAPAAILLALSVAVSAFAQVPFTAPEWALRADFPVTPRENDQTVPTPYGEQLALRRYAEKGADRAMLIRFVYPLVPPPSARERLYNESIETLMTSRPGKLRVDEPFPIGDYTGRRLLIEHERDRTHREVRLLLVGGSLYVASAEWAGGDRPAPAAARFLASLQLQSDFANPRVVEERERWREIRAGNFSLRYDATRWFRDPEVTDAGTFVLLRADELAEAEFITNGDRQGAESMEERILAGARENAESVKLHRRGRKLRGAASVEELCFAVRIEGVTYENHGYFYTGPEGTVQLRAWSPNKTYAQVESDIGELLDGLVVRGATATGR